MKKHFPTLALVAPLSVLVVGCGSQGNPKGPQTDPNELSYSMSDESDEVVADHVDDVMSELALQDSSDSPEEISLGLSSERSSTREKSCLVSDSTLTLSKTKSKDALTKKTTRKGSIERSFAHDSSFQRIYKPADGRALPLACASAQGPIKIIQDKLADFQGLNVSAKRESSKSLEVKNSKGEVLHARKSEVAATRSAVFASASIADQKITLLKSVSLKSSAQIVSIKKGVEEKSTHSYSTEQDAPLVIEVVREAVSEKLISKTIKSGQVVIQRASGTEIKISYDMVKFSSVCQPESGQMKVSRVNVAEGKTVDMVIKFVGGEAFTSKNGGAEEKMESLNLRLEGCRSK